MTFKAMCLNEITEMIRGLALGHSNVARSRDMEDPKRV